MKHLFKSFTALIAAAVLLFAFAAIASPAEQSAPNQGETLVIVNDVATNLSADRLIAAIDGQAWQAAPVECTSAGSAPTNNAAINADYRYATRERVDRLPERSEFRQARNVRGKTTAATQRTRAVQHL